MDDPPPLPPSQPPSTGGEQGGNDLQMYLIDKVLNQLKDCGVNTTTFNMSSIFSMNFTQQLLYLNNVLVVHNCSGNSSGPVQPTLSSESSPHVALVIYFSIIMVLGLLVNLCVIGTICRVRRLRTITNCFVLSLSLADLLMAAVVVPLKIYELFQHQVNSPFLDTVFPILGVSSLLNLCAVTLDRYFTITNPLTYETRVNDLQAGLIIAAIWTISITQELVHFAVSSNSERLFQVIRFVIVFSIPFICVMFVNTKIYCIARGHARQIRANEPGQNNSNGRSFSRKMKTAQVIGLLVGTFILTWLPYFIMTIYEHFQEERMTKPKNKQTALDIGKMITASLACSTALFNPLLYGFLRKEVRIAIIKGLKCQNVNQSDFDTTGTAENTTKRMEITQK